MRRALIFMLAALLLLPLLAAVPLYQINGDGTITEIPSLMDSQGEPSQEQPVQVLPSTPLQVVQSEAAKKFSDGLPRGSLYMVDEEVRAALSERSNAALTESLTDLKTGKQYLLFEKNGNSIAMRDVDDAAAITAVLIRGSSELSTDIAIVEDVTLANATIRLNKHGSVAAVGRCDIYNQDSGICDSGWVNTGIAFTDYGSYIEFTVDHFTGYGGIPQSEKLYVTGTTDTATGSLAVSQDGIQNSYAQLMVSGNLYTMMNASKVNVTGMKIRTTDSVNFSTYWSTGSRVDAVYATFKLYANGVLVCQSGNDNTGGVQVPDGATGLRTGNCSPSSDFTVPNGATLNLVVNAYAQTIGGGGTAATRTATLLWDTTTADTWVSIVSVQQVDIILNVNPTAGQGTVVNMTGLFAWSNGTAVPDKNVTVQLLDAANITVQLRNVTTNGSGHYSDTYALSSDADIGTWAVIATGWYNSSDYAVNTSTFTVFNPSPTVHSVTLSPNPAANGSTVSVTANVTDNNAVSTVYAQIFYPNGTLWQNLSMSGSNPYTASFTSPASPLGNYTVRIWANDTSNGISNSANSSFIPYVTLSQNLEITIDGSFSDWNGTIVADDSVTLRSAWNSTPDAELVGWGDSDQAGRSVAIGDVNNDGLNDIIIGADLAEGSNNECVDGSSINECGSAQIYYGRANGSWNSIPDAELMGWNSSDYAGTSIAVGDVNNDGLNDVVLGAYLAEGPNGKCADGLGTSNCGSAQIYYGINSSRSWNSTPDVELVGLNNGDSAGRSVAVGDVNNDGLNDVVLGAYEASGISGYCADGASQATCGSAQIYYGRANGSWNSIPDAELMGWNNGDYAGTSIAVGDVNNDGLNDVVLGAHQAKGPNGKCADGVGTSNCGSAQIYYGINSSRSWNSTPDAELVGWGDSDQAGWSVAVGDVNNDGLNDVVLGAHQAKGPNGLCADGVGTSNCGSAQIYYGINSSRSWNSTPDVELVGLNSADYAGKSVAVGDVNNDGLNDIVLDASFAEDSSGLCADGLGTSNCGSAQIYYGRANGSLNSTPDAELVGLNSLDYAGTSTAVGDVNNDGLNDVVLGAYGAVGSNGKCADGIGTSLCGSVQVYYGIESTTGTDIGEISFSGSNMFNTYINLSSAILNSNYYRLFIGNGSGGNTTSPSGSALPFVYTRYIQVNGSSCLIFSSAGTQLGTCTKANSTTAIELNASLSSIGADEGGVLNITVEVGAPVRKDLAPDASSFISYTIASGVDTTAPVVSAVHNTVLNASTVSIEWTTDENANSSVQYGTTLDLAGGSNGSDSLATGQNIMLYGLDSAHYYYNITSCDALGYCSTVGPYNFSTVPAFVSSWNTSAVGDGSTSSTQVGLPLVSSGTYAFTVYWGDGTSDYIASWNQAQVNHTYSSAGVYQVRINGTIEGWRFNYAGDREKLLDISSWGPLQLGNDGGYFYGASNLNISATDTLDLTGMTDFSYAFASSGISIVPGMASWDVSNITNMNNMFYSAPSFNQDISSWNTSNVTDMAGMFGGTFSFNQPLGSWDVSSVTNMSGMFFYSLLFNQPLGSWDVSNVTDMNSMFADSSFDQDISSWDVSDVTDMSYMFASAPFNQPLGSWEVGNVTDMKYMFYTDSSFDQDISSWDVRNVTSMQNMLYGANLSTPNYDGLLIGWASRPVQQNVIFHGGNSKYSSFAVSARNTTLIGVNGWTITDGGLLAVPVISDVSNSSITTTSAHINWSTDIAANSSVQYGTTTALIVGSNSSASDVTAHALWLHNLQPGTLYYYNVTSCNADGCDTEGNFNFTTINLFITRWNTSATSAGSSNATQVKLPLESGGTYNFTVDWGDGNSGHVTAWNDADANHTYAAAGIYEVRINGTIVGWRFNNAGDKLKLIEISRWGDLRLGDSGGYFFGATNLNVTATDLIDLSGTTTMASAFRSAGISTVPNIGEWDVSGITNMAFMFMSSKFNDDISGWNTSNVLSASSMFYGTPFNQDISGWDTSNVTTASWLFAYTTAFNQSLNGWNTSKVTDMSSMFNNAAAFNNDISSWDTSNVVNMYSMFYVSEFNGNISGWDTHNVTNMGYMFSGADSFNQNIGAWNVSAVTNMGLMFSGVELSTPNYDGLLIGWASRPVQPNVAFSGGNSKYSAAALSARNATLIGANGWTITDGGLLNAAPLISSVQSLPAQTPIEGNVLNVSVLFNASDADGAGDLANATARAVFSKDGVSREGACINTTLSATAQQFNCTVGMQYYDLPGTWSVNVSVNDSAASAAYNTTTNFTYNELKAIQLSVASLGFGSQGMGQWAGASVPVVVSNLGNVNLTTVNLTSYDLVNGSYSISADSFSVSTADAPDQLLASGEPVTVLGAYVQPHTDSVAVNESLYIWVSVPSGLPALDYEAGTGWEVYVE